MGDISRFIEAAIISAVFAAGVVCMNYSSRGGCDHGKPVTAMTERGASRLVIN